MWGYLPLNFGENDQPDLCFPEASGFFCPLPSRFPPTLKNKIAKTLPTLSWEWEGWPYLGPDNPGAWQKGLGSHWGSGKPRNPVWGSSPWDQRFPRLDFLEGEKLNRHGARACSGRWSPLALSLRRWGSSQTWRTRERILPTDSGKIPLESGGTGGWNSRVISPSLPLSLYTEFRKILSNGIVVIVIIRMPFPKNPVDFKPLNPRAHINNMEEARCLNILRLRKSRME